MRDEEEYEDAHNESRESLLDPPVVVCPIGDRQNCEYFIHDGDDEEADYWCEHPTLGEDADECPLDAIESEAESHGIDMDDDPGNQDEED